MKKLFLMSAFALMGVVANAAEHVGTVVTTSCGKQIMTVAPEFFSKSEEFVDYRRFERNLLRRKKRCSC